MTDAHFTRVTQTLFEAFGLGAALATQPGTSLMHRASESGAPVLLTWSLPHHDVVMATEGVMPQVRRAVQPSARLDVDALVAALGFAPEHHSQGPLFSTDATRFTPPPTPPDRYTLRVATPQHDGAAAQAFLAACSEDDRDEGQVSIDDELAFAAFDGDTMVALATMYHWYGLADIGVLVHPGHRGVRLGRAVVGGITQMLLDVGEVTSYRVDATNKASWRLAAGLGYRQYGENHWIVLPQGV